MQISREILVSADAEDSLVQILREILIVERHIGEYFG